MASSTPFTIERVYNAPVARVWQAITDNEKMKQWYFELKEFKPQVGFVFEFWGGDEQKQYLHRCEVTEVVPEKKLSYTWTYPELTEGVSEVTFELFPEGNNTRLKLTHKGIESFKIDDPNFRLESFAAGWTDIIGSNLKAYVEGTAVEKQ